MLVSAAVVRRWLPSPRMCGIAARPTKQKDNGDGVVKLYQASSAGSEELDQAHLAAMQTHSHVLPWPTEIPLDRVHGIETSEGTPMTNPHRRGANQGR